MRHLLLLLLLAGCVGGPPPAPPRSAPRFDIFAFFTGRTHGEGRLHIVFRSAYPVHVDGQGRREGDILVLDQRVTEDGKRPREREWRIREVASGRYTGTLTDAAGPVSGDVTGDLLHLAFPMKGGLRAEQWLTLAPDGRSARNILRVEKFGLTVARLDETIRKTD